ncbi:MAG: PAS domain-containing sensor histidine kinase [Ginsengibacter sp.]
MTTNKPVTVEQSNKKIKDLEKALAYAEAIIGTVREPLLVLYPGSKIKTASKSFYKTFKVRRKDTEGKLIFDLGNGQWDIPLLKTLLNEILQKKTILNDFEVEHRFEYIGHKVMLLNARKLDVGRINDPMILLAIEDITDKKTFKSVETERKTILENFPSALIIIDKERRITYCNKQAELIMGKKVKRIVGKNILDVFPKTGSQDFQEQYHKIVTTGVPAIFEDYYHSLKAWLQVRAFPSKTGMSVYLDDISKRKQAEKHLEELSRQKDEFVGIASHELKTPVTSIKGYTQILKMRFAQEKNAKAVEMLTRMDRQIDKLTTLINDLLDVTKIEGGTFQFHNADFDFNGLVTEIIEEMQQTTQHHTIITKLALTSGIYGDRDRIGQVITNFLSNAIKYSPGSNKVILTTSKETRNITLCVQDFGIGISKDKQAKVFDRFFRVSGLKENTFPGLGLGLFISAEIIKRHRGTISVKSVKNQGSTFYFSLPVKKR